MNIGTFGKLGMLKRQGKFWVITLLNTFLFLCGCSRDYNSKHINKKPSKVSNSEDHLSKQAVKITQENIDNKDVRVEKSGKRSEKEQKRLNELNVSPYKPKARKTNDRVYDIY